jgi:hypothetical protein
VITGVVAVSVRPAWASEYRIVNTNGLGVRQRVEPAVGSAWSGVAPEGAAIAVVCQQFVPAEPMGPFGNTLWLKVQGSGTADWYVNDTFTDSPRYANGPALAGIPLCDAPPPAVETSVGCYGDYCSGQDPMTTRCADDAVTTAYSDITAARVEVRWSPTCRTNWARYVQYPRGWYFGNVPIELRAVQDTGYTQRLAFDVNGDPVGTSHTFTHDPNRGVTGAAWTPMIYSPVHLVRAELVVACGGVGDCAQGALLGLNPITTAWS